MAASEAALILKYFGRAVLVSSGSKTVHNHMSKVLSPATTVASTLQRLSEAPKRPVLSAQAEVDNDASRMLAFLQKHGPISSSKAQGSPAKASSPVQSILYTQSFPDSSRLPKQDRRYRNAGQTLQMMGFQNVANFRTQHQWLQARATLDMNPNPMIRARSGIPAAHM